MWHLLLQEIKQGNIKALARTISLIENEYAGYFEFLQQLPESNTKIVGITGPPGAGKSTLVDALIGEMIMQEKKIAVLCVDPSSPFNFGALLGDRIRMNQWYSHPNVFIRSLATRGSLGGLHPKIMEITDILKTALFDYVIIETVGVGQSEIEIAGLADTTVVVLVPEAGDEIQTMKAGLMEIADVFVVNKADRPESAAFIKNLQQMLAPAFHKKHNEVFIVKAIATQNDGIAELYHTIKNHQLNAVINDRKYFLLAEKAYYLIQQFKMKTIAKQDLQKEIEISKTTNIYSFIKPYIN